MVALGALGGIERQGREVLGQLGGARRLAPSRQQLARGDRLTLRTNGSDADDLAGRVEAALGQPSRKRGLKSLAQTLLQRQYRVVEDGVAIAALTTEAQVPPEIRALLHAMLA